MGSESTCWPRPLVSSTKRKKYGSKVIKVEGFGFRAFRV